MRGRRMSSPNWLEQLIYMLRYIDNRKKDTLVLETLRAEPDLPDKSSMNE
jgi:hypothetical protein